MKKLFKIREEWPSLVLLAGMLAAGALLWSHVPEQIPVHWGVDGTPDRFGGRFEGLFVIPIIALSLYVLMSFLSLIKPSEYNRPLPQKASAKMKLLMNVFMAAVYVFAVLNARGAAIPAERFMTPALGFLFIALSFLIRNLPPNSVAGVRIPGAMNDSTLWQKNQQAGSIAMLILGIILIPMVFFPPMAGLIVLIAGSMLMVLVLLIYSFRQQTRHND